jgi:hypothetical protein
VSLVTKARKELAMDFHSKQEQNQVSPFIDTPDYTFTLPDLSVHDEDFRKFLERDLIECATLNSLESCQRLNWWVEIGLCRKLWPLSTSGVRREDGMVWDGCEFLRWLWNFFVVVEWHENYGFFFKLMDNFKNLP